MLARLFCLLLVVLEMEVALVKLVDLAIDVDVVLRCTICLLVLAADSLLHHNAI